MQLSELHDKARETNYTFVDINIDVKEYTGKDWNNALTNGVLFDQKGDFFRICLKIEDKYISYVDTEGDEGLRYYDSLAVADLLHIMKTIELLTE